MSNTDLTFTNNEALHRYEAALDGKLAAYAEYNLLTDAIMFTHTEVLPEHSKARAWALALRSTCSTRRARRDCM
jgi:predicted GNAT family acetyltransferase